MEQRDKVLIAFTAIFLAGIGVGLLVTRAEINELRRENTSMKQALTHIITQQLNAAKVIPSTPTPPPAQASQAVPSHEEIRRQFEEAQQKAEQSSQ